MCSRVSANTFEKTAYCSQNNRVQVTAPITVPRKVPSSMPIALLVGEGAFCLKHRVKQVPRPISCANSDFQAKALSLS